MAKLIGRASGTAVGAALTTVIDWVNIQYADDFEIIIKNVGGGTGSTITDVQGDTSSDGGTTNNLNDVTDAEMNITVPIVATITEPSTAVFSKSDMTTATNKWLRIRAITLGDTTVNCWLTATTTDRMTLDELADEVRRMAGASSDTELLTAVRVYKHIHWAQREIARRIPGLDDLHVEDKTALTLVTNTKSYSLTALPYPACHIDRVRMVDSTAVSNCVDLDFVPLDAFDRKWPYPEGDTASKPAYYTRRGNAIEVYPIPSSSYNGLELYMDYSKWPAELSAATDEPDLADADELLIQGGLYRSYRALGHAYRTEAKEEKESFEYMLDEWRGQQTRLLDWPGQVLPDPSDDLEP